jgi:hypothetical protein
MARLVTEVLVLALEDVTLSSAPVQMQTIAVAAGLLEA